MGEASRATRLVLVDWADADGVARELGGCPFLGRYLPFFSRGCCDFGDIHEMKVRECLLTSPRGGLQMKG